MPAAIPTRVSDYSLVGEDARRAINTGLAEAAWYASPVPKEAMRALLRRRDGPAVRDTVLWFGLIFGSGWVAWQLWRVGSWWAVFPFLVYGVLYASTSDSRWHESGHGTAFKTDWMNNVLYEIASFMVMRESTVWRWSHMRHHSDTIIVGRDPEIAVPRPPDIPGLVLSFFSLKAIPKYFWHVVLHCAGRLTPEEKTFIPESEYGKVFLPGPALRLDLRGRHRAGRLPTQHSAADVHRAADALRLVADADLRLHAARRLGGKRPRPPAELPHGLHGSPSTATFTGT